MKNYTKIPNELFEESDLSINSRYLLCILLKFCRQKDICFPGQKTLGVILGFSDRHIRNLITELVNAKLITVKRTGFNKVNTYKVSKDIYRNNSSCPSITKRNSSSYHLGSAVPLTAGTPVPTNSTQLKEIDKNFKVNLRGLEKCRKLLKRKGFNIGSTRGGGAN